MATHTLSADLATLHADRPELAQLLSAVTHCGTEVAALIARTPADASAAPLTEANASGDVPKALDLQAEVMFVDAMAGADVLAICSEETELPIPVNPDGTLVLALDPIDGSSNIDINAPIGTIFAVLPVIGGVEESLLQTGRHQLAAGIIIYGPRTVIALTWGAGTALYSLDPESGEYLRTHDVVTLPADAVEYAINASNARHWTPSIRAYVNDLVSGSIGPRNRDFNMRWLASLVAETYRILLRGGIFLYPGDERPGYSDGRIRLVYEANPVAFLCEQAGGTATNGVDPILDLQPTALHQRTPLVFGSSSKVERVRRYLLDPPTMHEESPLFGQRGLFRN